MSCPNCGTKVVDVFVTSNYTLTKDGDDWVRTDIENPVDDSTYRCTKCRKVLPPELLEELGVT